MTIPEFPEFRLFTFDDINWYTDFYLRNGLKPYTDINPNNLNAWLNINKDLSVSDLNGGIVFKYTNIFNDNRLNVLPLHNPLDDGMVSKVMQFLSDNALPLELREIPADICRTLDTCQWEIENDRDGCEYILDNQQQYELVGSDFSRQRRRIGYFERLHENDKIEVLYHEEIGDDVAKTFRNHIQSYPLNSNEESSGCSDEAKAVAANLEHSLEFHKHAMIIRINDHDVSLSLLSDIDDNIVALNHLKVDYSVKYIFQYTIYQLSKILHEKGFSEINIEQDLGYDGIRTFKERLHPSRLLEKKLIRPIHL